MRSVCEQSLFCIEKIDSFFIDIVFKFGGGGKMMYLRYFSRRRSSSLLNCVSGTLRTVRFFNICFYFSIVYCFDKNEKVLRNNKQEIKFIIFRTSISGACASKMKNGFPRI